MLVSIFTQIVINIVGSDRGTNGISSVKDVKAETFTVSEAKSLTKKNRGVVGSDCTESDDGDC